MGYDMYVVNEHGERIKNDCHPEHYWRRNISGGARQAQRFVDAGMGYWPRHRRPDNWPEMPEGCEWDDKGNLIGPAAAEYEQQLFAFLKATYDEQPGIAVYKLCDSNDGWWVTAAECRSALQLWERNNHPDVDPYGDTIPFLQAAADHHGFRVW